MSCPFCDKPFDPSGRCGCAYYLLTCLREWEIRDRDTDEFVCGCDKEQHARIILMLLNRYAKDQDSVNLAFTTMMANYMGIKKP